MTISSLKTLAGRLGRHAACLAILGAAACVQTARSAPSYASAVLANNPVAFWQLNETTDPSTGGVLANDSSGNGFAGTYGSASYNAAWSIYGPQPPTYAGFPANGGAFLSVNGSANSVITLPPLNLANLNTTISMWINPVANSVSAGGLLFCRNGTDIGGLGFGTTANSGGMYGLGYNWNNTAATSSFSSSLYPLIGAWQYVALVITSTNATIYLYYLDPNTSAPVLQSVVNNVTNGVVNWSSGVLLGSDNNNTAGRAFYGEISDAAIFNSALTPAQILAQFGAGIGVSGFAPSITTQPNSRTVLAGSKVQFGATGINGTAPIR